MSLSYIHNYFSENHILLKSEWLEAAVDYIHHTHPISRNFTNEKMANLIFEQWKFSSFESSSFPTFANHQIGPSTSKLELRSPLVCQINAIIDIGSSYYSQFLKLDGKVREDNTGFDTVFQEKEDDNDKKATRMLKLKLSDGECMIHAIEVIKIQQLSLYIKPGCKLLICPPVKLRKGVFLLKPNNCRVIGGEYLPALEEFRPLDQYKKLLKIEGKCKPIKEKPKPPPPPTPTIPDATTSPDVFNDFPDDVFEDFPNENPVVTVSNISQRLPNEQFDCDSPSIKPKIARVTPKVQKTEIAGTLSTQRAPPPPLDIRIEDDEEPINYEPKKHDNSLNLSVKTEIVDSDIEIIHLDDDEPTTIQAVKEEPQKPKTNPLVEAFNALKCSDLNESQRRMKYIIGSKKFLILAFVHDILEPLRVVDNLWTMKVKLKDDSGTVDSFVDNATLEKMIGYTCQEAIEIRKSSDIEKRKDGKRRLKALENQLQRLDLIMEIEFFNGSTSVPVIRSIKTLAEQLDAY